MRRLIPFALALAALGAGCGGDEPEEQTDTAAQRPAPRQPAVDTTIGDTAAADADVNTDVSGAATGAGEGASPSAGAGGAGAASSETRGVAADGAAAPASARTQGRLYTVQVAAFMEPETARLWESRLSSEGLPVWTSLAELRGRTFHRLRVGAVPEFEDARRLGRWITDRYEWPVWVAPLTPSDQLPPDAVARTRELLDRP